MPVVELPAEGARAIGVGLTARSLAQTDAGANGCFFGRIAALILARLAAHVSFACHNYLLSGIILFRNAMIVGLYFVHLTLQFHQVLVYRLANAARNKFMAEP